MESVLGLVRHPGNDALFRAIEMSLLATLAGQPLHIHAEGLRGTGKTTIMRAARRILPRIRRIQGCLYNCDPAEPHCPAHRGLTSAQIAGLGEEWVPMPFLEISHSAKIGTVVGSIDLGRLVRATEPEAALLPGTIPQAHRGIIFVDEVNRLAETSPELADVLLDAMGTKPGRVQIEETGLPPVELPVQISVWAASNPDEDPGPLEEIRRQLSDRFDFAIYTDRPGEPGVVERILAMVEQPGSRSHAVAETQAELWRTRLALRLADLRKVEIPAPIRQQVAGLYSRFELESLRAVQAIQAGVRLSACLENRSEALLEDLQRIVPMALRHRVDLETVRKVVAHIAGGGEKAEAGAAAARSRFPGLSFGGVVAEAPPPAPLIQPPPAARPPLSTGGTDADSWLRRTLSQLRIGRSDEQSGSQQQPLGLDRATPPAHLSEPRDRGEQRAHQRGPANPIRPGEEQGGEGEARDGRGDRRSQPGSGRLPDPAEHPPEAPPHRAQPLSSLRPEEWVRTEEELRRP